MQPTRWPTSFSGRSLAPRSRPLLDTGASRLCGAYDAVVMKGARALAPASCAVYRVPTCACRRERRDAHTTDRSATFDALASADAAAQNVAHLSLHPRRELLPRACSL